jgi:hypothetical protein
MLDIEVSNVENSASNKPDSSNPRDEPNSGSEYKQLRTNDFNLSESGFGVERKTSYNPQSNKGI